MKSISFLIILAVVAGSVLPIQAGLNAKMGKVVGDPVYAALISFVVGSIGLLIYSVATGVELGQISRAGEVSWTVWLAGILGAFYVAAVVILVPKIGAALTFSLVVAGQMLLSLLLDHFGWLGLNPHPFNWQRMVGILLVVGGVIMIRKF